jgi:hypothetical protein
MGDHSRPRPRRTRQVAAWNHVVGLHGGRLRGVPAGREAITPAWTPAVRFETTVQRPPHGLTSAFPELSRREPSQRASNRSRKRRSPSPPWDAGYLRELFLCAMTAHPLRQRNCRMRHFHPIGLVPIGGCLVPTKQRTRTAPRRARPVDACLVRHSVTSLHGNSPGTSPVGAERLRYLEGRDQTIVHGVKPRSE